MTNQRRGVRIIDAQNFNWRARFAEIEKMDYLNRVRAYEISSNVYEYRQQQNEARGEVGDNGAQTAYCRVSASRSAAYPDNAKYNFAIIDTAGRRRILTPHECLDCGFDWVLGTSNGLPFIKNFRDPFYVQYKNANQDWLHQLNTDTDERMKEAHDIRERHQNTEARNELYREYLASYEWNLKRKKVLKRDEYRCQLCGVDTGLEVHHLTYKRVGDEALFDLVTLCFQCHRQEHAEATE